MKIERLTALARLYELASESGSLIHTQLGAVEAGTTKLEFPRFVLNGARGGGDYIRFGIFAGIHGDEPAGVAALVRLLELLVAQPELAQGYRLFIYPACNPSGLLTGRRESATGKDLNREFWKDSREAEVRMLEKEIRSENFHGLISLHTDDTSPGVYGFVRGAVLSKALLEPALRAAEGVLPRNNASIIDGFPAHDGIISECYEGILTSPPKESPLTLALAPSGGEGNRTIESSHEPFEIILETPAGAPEEKQVEAFVRALTAILSAYQQFLAFAADL